MKMKFFKLLTLFAVTIVQGARVLNFTQYDAEWVKGKDYNIQYSYLEEPTFSNFQIRLYNSTKSIELKEISTSDYSEKDIHSVTLSYPEAITGRYKIVGLSEGEEISNNFSVKLVLKASPTTTSTPSSTTINESSTQTTDTNTNTNANKDKKENDSNTWKTIAIIVLVLAVLLILSILGFVLYRRYKNNKKYEEEANTSIWKVPISEKSMIASNRGVNVYSVPNASVTERDLSFSSDLDGFYSYSSQVRNPDYFTSSMGYRERKERTKSVYSYSTNVTKASNNILDILYPTMEKKEKEKSLHEKSEVSIDLGHSHSQKSAGKRKKHNNTISNGQLRNPRSRSTERGKSYPEARARSNSFKANAIATRKSRVSLAESENAILSKKSKASLSENEKNTHMLNQINENDGDISLNNINTSPSVQKNDEALINTPEYYIKHTKLNKKYIALCNFKPKLTDEMSITKNDIIVIHEVFTDGWGLGRNITTDKEGLLPLNCLNIEA
ncbi:hypothetical protein BCR36DRAFT_364758 [Piromyces finnis]|uniref:SH3 domain-containing protein n=1 Tax=Piromyces finnis TaxID=1754191 RepID=A0A1Y1UQM9_9FUNG|nr:hypothetical protein BCR36DRAFT_364758 [Piromyces finnis]|eukprot:ORX40360.1 hypothetical protein BCR36DRAFT_364758 [Piromyces finnis]